MLAVPPDIRSCGRACSCHMHCRAYGHVRAQAAQLRRTPKGGQCSRRRWEDSRCPDIRGDSGPGPRSGPCPVAAHSGPHRTPTPEAACMASSAQKTGPQTRGWQFIHVLWAAYAKYSIQTSCTAYMVCTCTLNTNGIGMKGAWHVSCSHVMHITRIRVESPLPRHSLLD